MTVALESLWKESGPRILLEGMRSFNFAVLIVGALVKI
jgi:hypothetical protein